MKIKEMEESNNEGVIIIFRYSLDLIFFDLIGDIFLKFFVKFFVEFICVSKIWYFIIFSKMFINIFMLMFIFRFRFFFIIKRNYNEVNELIFFFF